MLRLFFSGQSLNFGKEIVVIVFISIALERCSWRHSGSSITHPSIQSNPIRHLAFSVLNLSIDLNCLNCSVSPVSQCYLHLRWHYYNSQRSYFPCQRKSGYAMEKALSFLVNVLQNVLCGEKSPIMCSWPNNWCLQRKTHYLKHSK